MFFYTFPPCYKSAVLQILAVQIICLQTVLYFLLTINYSFTFSLGYLTRLTDGGLFLITYTKNALLCICFLVGCGTLWTSILEAPAIANVAKKCAKNSQCSEWNKKGYMGHSYGGNCIKTPRWKQQMCTKIVGFDSARVCSWAQKAFETQVSGVSLPFVFQQNSSIYCPVMPLENFTCVVHKLPVFLPVSGLFLYCCMNIHWQKWLHKITF